MTTIPGTVIKRRKKKVSKEAYKKRCKQGLNTISNILSRVELSRKKIIWDVFEEIRISKIGIKVRRKSLENEISLKSDAKPSSVLGKTEPSTEISQQVIDKTDLDYYFLEKLEQMRDRGIKDEEYDLIERNEKYSLERDDSFDEIGYNSDIDRSKSEIDTEKISRKLSRGSKDFGDGNMGEYEEEEKVYLCKNPNLQALEEKLGGLKQFDDKGNSSVYTLELKSILKDCNIDSKLSDVNSDITLSK